MTVAIGLMLDKMADLRCDRGFLDQSTAAAHFDSSCCQDMHEQSVTNLNTVTDDMELPGLTGALLARLPSWRSA